MNPILALQRVALLPKARSTITAARITPPATTFCQSELPDEIDRVERELE